MKFVVSYTQRPGTTFEDSKKAMDVYSKWTPSPSITFREFVQRVDGRGGFAVVETDDPAGLLRDAMTFSPWLEFETHAVLDAADAMPVQSEVTELLASIL